MPAQGRRSLLLPLGRSWILPRLGGWAIPDFLRGRGWVAIGSLYPRDSQPGGRVQEAV